MQRAPRGDEFGRVVAHRPGSMLCAAAYSKSASSRIVSASLSSHIHSATCALKKSSSSGLTTGS